MGWFWRAALLTIAACVQLGSAAAAPVMTDAGALQGVSAGPLTTYKGVPFAAPPVGALRWREPQPVPPWEGVRRADAFAPACMQTGVSMPGEAPPAVSEDCLYLNIWTPAKSSRARLPVMVWIPGGGFTNGSAAMPLYWGDRLARKGVIVVTVAYRLGPLGFLAHPELTRESSHGASGNYGLMDQIAALRWVKRNIGGFGGDPMRVTVAGQSAGSNSVSLLLASPLAKGLFQRAIGESGGVLEPLQIAPAYRLANAERDGEAYAASLGAHSIADLRGLPAADLLKGGAAAVSHPIVEPYVLPAPPYDAFAAGSQSDVPTLIGFNAEEPRAFSDISKVGAANFMSDAPAWWPPPLRSPALLATFPHATDEEARQSRVDLETALRYGWDVWAWARLQASRGKGAVYVYRFDQRPPFPADSVYANWGAAHFVELWYVFDHLDQQPWRWSSADRRLADMISSYWTNFVKRGDPNGPGLPTWPTFTPQRSQILYLDDPVKADPFPVTVGMRTIEYLYNQARGAPLGPAASADTSPGPAPRVRLETSFKF
ncbi:MAG TPA: carboxylesterase family protein [Caulobacteraceae bacterium]|jgi:para-nitrobenzyl esterase